MREVFVKVNRDDSCPICNEDRCVDIYDVTNKSIKYTLVLDKLEQGIDIDLSNSKLKYAKCSLCGHKFTLDWTNNLKIPRPFYLTQLKDLMMDMYFNNKED